MPWDESFSCVDTSSYSGVIIKWLLKTIYQEISPNTKRHLSTDEYKNIFICISFSSFYFPLLIKMYVSHSIYKTSVTECTGQTKIMHGYPH